MLWVKWWSGSLFIRGTKQTIKGTEPSLPTMFGSPVGKIVDLVSLSENSSMNWSFSTTIARKNFVGTSTQQ